MTPITPEPRLFETVIVVDWSAASRPVKGKDSIWIGQAGQGGAPPVNPATRSEAMKVLEQRIDAALAKGRRVLIGADFPFAYPTGFARALTGQAGALALWSWFADRVIDLPDNQNNRFVLADKVNAGLPGVGPFWGRPAHLNLPDLPEKGSTRRDMTFPERRVVEQSERRLQPVWKLYTTGSVGSQAILGIARLAALRKRLGPRCAVWPLEPWSDAEVVLAEVWPSLLARPVAAARPAYDCTDAAQVDLLARALAGLADDELSGLLQPDHPAALLAEEGWILGAGQSLLLELALERSNAGNSRG